MTPDTDIEPVLAELRDCLHERVQRGKFVGDPELSEPPKTSDRPQLLKYRRYTHNPQAYTWSGGRPRPINRLSDAVVRRTS